MSDQPRRTVLLTGASGYVGGRLLDRLTRRGERVRCLSRDPDKLRQRVGDGIEVRAGDVADVASLRAALDGTDAAYYLIHSMGDGDDFMEKDRRAAENFARASGQAGLHRIVYLGGLGEDGEDLSPHLRSRHEVGQILRAGPTPCVELRSSVVIGKGSLSFEMIRSLTERLPVMLCPRWLKTKTQPIAIDDLLDYLTAALDLPPGPARVYEIGGADEVRYGDLIREYARQRGLRRLMLPVPLLSPYLSGLWLGLVTPVEAGVGRHLIEGLRNPTVVRDPSARSAFEVRPVGVAEAIRRALAEA